MPQSQSIVVHVKKSNSAKSNVGTLYLVHVLTHASRSKLDDALRHLQLSSFQYTILSVLAHNENLSSSRLSRRFHVTPQAMGEIILLLEKKGFIERREDPDDRRAKVLTLTPAGRALMDGLAASLADRVEASLAGMAGSVSDTMRPVFAALRQAEGAPAPPWQADGIAPGMPGPPQKRGGPMGPPKGRARTKP